PWVWAEGQRIAGTSHEAQPVSGFTEARSRDGLFLLAADTVQQKDVTRGAVTAEAGRGARAALTLCLEAARRSEIDALCFAPLNKQAMKKGGMAFEDELHFFADYLGVTGYFCEFNTLGNLWTS